ncbi:hypothetical protein HY493_00475 [Candidatus Woesearchaeota archaeon]|nr:hypothetical protein [Candidatus Woesearchaeota archaeon]
MKTILLLLIVSLAVGLFAASALAHNTGSGMMSGASTNSGMMGGSGSMHGSGHSSMMSGPMMSAGNHAQCGSMHGDSTNGARGMNAETHRAHHG